MGFHLKWGVVAVFVSWVGVYCLLLWWKKSSDQAIWHTMQFDIQHISHSSQFNLSYWVTVCFMGFWGLSIAWGETFCLRKAPWYQQLTLQAWCLQQRGVAAIALFFIVPNSMLSIFSLNQLKMVRERDRVFLTVLCAAAILKLSRNYTRVALCVAHETPNNRRKTPKEKGKKCTTVMLQPLCMKILHKLEILVVLYCPPFPSVDTK